jgi:chorismate-pyruvate lyase
MDEYGERLISGTNSLGRILAGDHIVVRGTHVEEEEEVYVNGKLVAQEKREAPIIPITDLANVFYF